MPFNLVPGNMFLNFRSGLNDDLLSYIIRLSEQERGRVGTPPASKQVVENLPEVEITEKYCKKDPESGQIEHPRCAICHEDLTQKGTLLPCGHLYDRDCIVPWLKEHNQCPVCRFELPTDDPDYERRKS